MGQVTAGEPSEPTSERPTGAGRRSRRRREQRFLKAVELHAMAAAASWYAAQGYTVEDVSARKSWDLEAVRDDEVRRVEVKGSAGIRDAVDPDRERGARTPRTGRRAISSSSTVSSWSRRWNRSYWRRPLTALDRLDPSTGCSGTRCLQPPSPVRPMHLKWYVDRACSRRPGRLA